MTDEPKDIYEALSLVRQVIRPAERSVEGQRGKYADLYEVQRVSNDALTTHSILPYYTSQVHNEADRYFLVLKLHLRHVPSGTELESEYVVRLDKNEQAVGSSFTYGKRYLRVALLDMMILGEDDDAETATTAGSKKDGDLEKRTAQFARIKDAMKQLGWSKEDGASFFESWKADKDNKVKPDKTMKTLPIAQLVKLTAAVEFEAMQAANPF
jgi:hypothetical protein